MWGMMLVLWASIHLEPSVSMIHNQHMHASTTWILWGACMHQNAMGEEYACLAKGAFTKQHSLAVLLGICDVLVLDHAREHLRQEGRLARQRFAHRPPCWNTVCDFHLHVYFVQKPVILLTAPAADHVMSSCVRRERVCYRRQVCAKVLESRSHTFSTGSSGIAGFSTSLTSS